MGLGSEKHKKKKNSFLFYSWNLKFEQKREMRTWRECSKGRTKEKLRDEGLEIGSWITISVDFKDLIGRVIQTINQCTVSRHWWTCSFIRSEMKRPLREALAKPLPRESQSTQLLCFRSTQIKYWNRWTQFTGVLMLHGVRRSGASGQCPTKPVILHSSQTLKTKSMLWQKILSQVPRVWVHMQITYVLILCAVSVRKGVTDFGGGWGRVCVCMWGGIICLRGVCFHPGGEQYVWASKADWQS